MQLIVLECPPGFNVAGFLIDGEYSIGNRPLRLGLVLNRDPLIKIFPIEQDGGVGWRSSAAGARRHHLGHRLPDFRVLRFRGALISGRLLSVSGTSK